MSTLQPKHTKLDEKEAKAILEKFNISLAQLPKISKNDAAVPEGSQKGDLVKIERGGETPETYYRVVI